MIRAPGHDVGGTARIIDARVKGSAPAQVGELARRDNGIPQIRYRAVPYHGIEKRRVAVERRIVAPVMSAAWRASRGMSYAWDVASWSDIPRGRYLRHVDAEICAGYATGAAKAQLAAQLAGERREHLHAKASLTRAHYARARKAVNANTRS